MSPEREDLLRFARDLADPNWCLSVPVTAKTVISKLLAIIENETKGNQMSHTAQCRIRKELTGNIWVYYSEPDQQCKDASHDTYYTEASK